MQAKTTRAVMLAWSMNVGARHCRDWGFCLLPLGLERNGERPILVMRTYRALVPSRCMAPNNEASCLGRSAPTSAPYSYMFAWCWCHNG